MIKLTGRMISFSSNKNHPSMRCKVCLDVSQVTQKSKTKCLRPIALLFGEKRKAPKFAADSESHLYGNCQFTWRKSTFKVFFNLRVNLMFKAIIHCITMTRPAHFAPIMFGHFCYSKNFELWLILNYSISNLLYAYHAKKTGRKMKDFFQHRIQNRNLPRCDEHVLLIYESRSTGETI